MCGLRSGGARTIGSGGETEMVDTKIRAAGIGGSDVAAILGWDERRDAFGVWAAKRGLLEEITATPRMKLGKYFERGIIDFYSELTGRETVWLDETRRHPVYDFMVYTPDAVCIHERRGVDAKFVSWDQRHKWGATAEEIPARVQMQCHWYMAAMDYPLWDVAAFMGSDEPRIYTIERDAQFEEAILFLAEKFYRNYILGDERPPIGYSDESARYLRQHFPRHKLNLRDADEREALLLEQYAQIREAEKLVNEERVQVENEIKLAIADHEGLVWPRGRFTWRSTKDSVKTDWEALARSLLSHYAEDDRVLLAAEYSAIKPGIRRIHFQCDEAT
jgi:predicted phage-related endonuclease